MEEYKNKLLAMLSEKGFAKSPFTYDEIQSLFYNRISLDDAYSMACDVYRGIESVDDIETEEEDLEFLDSLCEDGLMP